MKSLSKHTSSVPTSFQDTASKPITGLPISSNKADITAISVPKNPITSSSTAEKTWEGFKTLVKQPVPNAASSKLNSVPPSVISSQKILDKAQYFEVFKLIYTVKNQDFMALPEIKQKVITYFEKTVVPETTTIYPTTGLTTQQLSELLDYKTQKQNLQANVLSKKKLNQEQQKLTAKFLEKNHQKMLENQKKQKALTEANKFK